MVNCQQNTGALCYSPFTTDHSRLIYTSSVMKREPVIYTAIASLLYLLLYSSGDKPVIFLNVVLNAFGSL
jgi:hypothetical protein